MSKLFSPVLDSRRSVGARRADGRGILAAASRWVLPIAFATAFVGSALTHHYYSGIPKISPAFSYELAVAAAARDAKSVSPGDDGGSILHTIPECLAAPWKGGEDLIGQCPSDLRPYAGGGEGGAEAEAFNDARSCALACCSLPGCISWQFRSGVGCLHGSDVRLGMEKDGVKAWCSDQVPKRWMGQYVLRRGGGKVIEDRRSTACNVGGWEPREQEGQCFGLGDERGEGRESA